MKKYLLLTLVCLSFAVTAAENDSAKLGQVEAGQGQTDCNSPQIAGCGPCYKLCIEQNKSDRGALKDRTSDSKTDPKRGSSTATKQ